MAVARLPASPIRLQDLISVHKWHSDGTLVVQSENVSATAPRLGGAAELSGPKPSSKAELSFAILQRCNVETVDLKCRQKGHLSERGGPHTEFGF